MRFSDLVANDLGIDRSMRDMVVMLMNEWQEIVTSANRVTLNSGAEAYPIQVLTIINFTIVSW